LQRLLADILCAAPALATKEQQDELIALLPDTPTLAVFLCDPAFVKVAYDDIENLSELERVLKQLKAQQAEPIELPPDTPTLAAFLCDPAYVKVDGKEVRLSSVPFNDRVQITEAYRRQQGREPTQLEIVTTWLRHKGGN